VSGNKEVNSLGGSDIIHGYQYATRTTSMSAGSPARETLMTSRFQLSRHPGWNSCYAENWTKVIDTIMGGPDRDSTAIILI
jgi:hypothetical protein